MQLKNQNTFIKTKKIAVALGIPVVLLLAAILAIGPGCGSGINPPPLVTCDINNSKFMALYNSFGTDIYGYDKQVYEYTFQTNVNGTLCSIGYQGHPNLIGQSFYKMDIINATTHAVLSTGNYSFDSSARSYQDIPDIALTANQPYIFRRTVINNLGDLSNTISHFKQIPAPFTPIVVGPIQITQTRTFELSGTTEFNADTNGVLGCLDFVFN